MRPIQALLHGVHMDDHCDFCGKIIVAKDGKDGKITVQRIPYHYRCFDLKQAGKKPTRE